MLANIEHAIVIAFVVVLNLVIISIELIVLAINIEANVDVDTSITLQGSICKTSTININ